MSELKPCPFCGVEVQNSDDDNKYPRKNPNGGYYVFCECCGARISQFYKYKNEGISWNTRPIEDALNARIAELEAAQRWIPVSERLPEPYEKVIALAKDCMNVDWVLPKELRQVGKGAFARLYNVTHWMPLPKLPEVQE